MKKSKIVKLILVAGLLTACKSNEWNDSNKRLYVRGDTVSHYSRAPLMAAAAYFWFRPYGYYQPGMGFRHYGYESSGFSSRAISPNVSRGGFGASGIHVGS